MKAKFGLRMLTVTLISAALLMSGCSGDDGDTGPAGPAGANGAAGANGLDGADGKNAEFTPIESCSVCHSSGDVDAVHAS